MITLEGKDLDNALMACLFWSMQNDTPQKRWALEQAIVTLPPELTGYENFDEFLDECENMAKLSRKLLAAIKKEEEAKKG